MGMDKRGEYCIEMGLCNRCPPTTIYADAKRAVLQDVPSSFSEEEHAQIYAMRTRAIIEEQKRREQEASVPVFSYLSDSGGSGIQLCEKCLLEIVEEMRSFGKERGVR